MNERITKEDQAISWKAEEAYSSCLKIKLEPITSIRLKLCSQIIRHINARDHVLQTIFFSKNHSI